MIHRYQPPDRDWLTLYEVSEDPRIKVRSETVRRWVHDGRLPAVKVGGQYRVMKSALEQFIRPAAEAAEEPTAGEAPTRGDALRYRRKAPEPMELV